jgi:hypothetical protein
LDWKHLGPYEILVVISPWAYWLNLPKNHHIHPVQPISRLNKVLDDPLPGQLELAPPPVIVQGEEEFEVERMEDSPVFRWQLQYLVKWKGYDEISWEPATNMDGLKAINEFHAQQPGKPRQWASWVLSIAKGGANVTVVLSEDRGKSADWCKSYGKYEVHGRIQVSVEGITFQGKESGFVGRNQDLPVVLWIWREDDTIWNIE